jgi:hypothetical protein
MIECSCVIVASCAEELYFELERLLD